MLLGFKRRFEPMVVDGSKTHTIRGLRKSAAGRPVTPKVGEICHCYVDPRQKSMRLLGRWPCVRVETIVISKQGTVYISPRLYSQGWLKENRLLGQLNLGFEKLDPEEKNALAWRDGFRGEHPFEEMFQFWVQNNELPFMGHIIHWDFNSPVGRRWIK
jgi:hypothetical protein